MTMSDKAIEALMQQLAETPVNPGPFSQGSGCFYCGSSVHAMAIPQRLGDWQPGPLCFIQELLHIPYKVW